MSRENGDGVSLEELLAAQYVLQQLVKLQEDRLNDPDRNNESDQLQLEAIQTVLGQLYAIHRIWYGG